MRKDFGAQCYLFPLPVLMVGTYGTGGRANVMNAAWGTISNAEPPCVVLHLDADRTTLENIRATGCFTVSPATEDTLAQADYVGLVHGRDVDKIARAGLHANPAAHVNAPVFDEFPMSLECKAVEICESGDCVRVKGEIVSVSADESILGENGTIDPSKLKPISFDPVNNAYLAMDRRAGSAFRDGLKFMK